MKWKKDIFIKWNAMAKYEPIIIFRSKHSLVTCSNVFCFNIDQWIGIFIIYFSGFLKHPLLQAVAMI